MAEFLDSVEGEIAFFRAIMRARPIGRHQSFHIITMRTSIHKDTGHWVTPDHIVHKLRSCYDWDALHAIELDAEAPDPTPSPSDELSNDPHFKNEMIFPPPDDPSYEAFIAPRRMRHTPSPPSTPEASESKIKPKSSKKRERGKSKANLAGLVSGDSDSSALTQESGDEGEGVLADSVATATDGETVDGDGEDVESHEPTTPEPSASTSKSKKRKSTGKRKLSGAAAVNASRAAARKKAAAAAAAASKK